ncbi:MAG: hypothetical protein Q9M50_05420 [Methylococcales bacterium]|nr:hypothetical protein [Methylococcales bacterium]
MLKKTTLAFLNFNESQQKIFTSLLVLSVRELNQEWDIVDKDTAQVIFIPYETIITVKRWNEIQKTYAKAILVAYSVDLNDLNVRWKLLKKETHLPNRAALIKLLNDIAKEESNNRLVL